MFALIISIIAIALVVALAGATLYYGGDAFTQGNARSTAAALVNQGQQIAGAWTLFEADHGGASPAALTDLTDTNNGNVSYLAAIPTAPVGAWSLNGSTIEVATANAITTEVCNAVGNLPGSGGVFKCEGDAGARVFSYNL